jgi:hypothetical protein
MRNTVCCNFMTLVLALCFGLSFLSTRSASAAVAAPEPNIDDGTENEQGPSQKAPPEVLHTIDITPVAKTSRRDDAHVESREYFYPFRSAISPRMGAVYNTNAIESDLGALYLVGFQYLFNTKSMKTYELGADVLTRGKGRMHAAKRWNLTRTRTRPFVKAGFGWVIDPDQGLSTLIRYQNLQARAGAGFEHLVASPLSLRAEIEVAAGMEEQEGIFALGYSWAW